MEEQLYMTTNLAKIAYLLLRSNHYIKIEKEDNQHVFYFPKDAEKDAKDYERGALVPAKIFNEKLKEVRFMIYQARTSI